MENVRVRFAPSPTGYVHVGNARTALFNWLFARHHGGTFVLRIEDTDVERSEERYETQLLEDLRWFGLDWDEGPDKGGPHGPYRQSERKEFYSKYATELIDQGHAYYCFCSAEQLEAERQEALKAGQQPKYSGRCRRRPRAEAARKVAAGEPAAVRLKIAEGVFTWNDLVHGPTSFSSEVIGDPVLVRSDGHPAYNYAVVIDDHRMEITHVIRGDDHISNTPRQLALYQAFAWNPPEFAHLSTILGSDRTRLSKRHGATSLQSFRDNLGVLPEALRNYLALLGWSPGDGVTEILNTEDLIAQFSFSHVTKSPAVFDKEKLAWLNHHYITQSPLKRLAELAVPFLEKEEYLGEGEGCRPEVRAWLERVVDVVRKNLRYLGTTATNDDAVGKKLRYLGTIPLETEFIFLYDAKASICAEEWKYIGALPGAPDVLRAFVPRVVNEHDLTYERFKQIVKIVQNETGRKGSLLFHPIRFALTGKMSGPELEKLIPIFEEGAKLQLAPPVKSTAQRLREFAQAAKINYEL